jgi:chlorobactene glucosyltransferase
MLAAQWFALALSLLGATVLAVNLRTLKPAEAYPLPERLPHVSVLVPARDEERNIEACVRSLLAQDYPGPFEVVVLDDRSTDRTREILDGLAREDARLRVLTGAPLPEGWLGKPWACCQLAEAAVGEQLLFTDADTRHARDSVSAGVADASAEKADMLTGLPHVETLTTAEALVLPAIPWSTATLLPLPLAYRVDWQWLSTANGQFLLIRRDAYEAIGGHAAVRAEVLEDMMMARRVKAAHLRWRIADVSDVVATRMYRNLREILAGLGKNLFGVFDYGVGRFLLVGGAFVLAFLLPPAVLLAAALGRPLPGASVPLAFVAWAVTTLQVYFGYRRLDYQPLLALLYPVTVALFALTALWSLALSLFSRRRWKGRSLGHARLRWL